MRLGRGHVIHRTYSLYYSCIQLVEVLPPDLPPLSHDPLAFRPWRHRRLLATACCMECSTGWVGHRYCKTQWRHSSFILLCSCPLGPPCLLWSLQVESWLSVEMQLLRVLNGLLNLASRMPALEAVASAPAQPDGEQLPSHACCCCLSAGRGEEGVRVRGREACRLTVCTPARAFAACLVIK